MEDYQYNEEVLLGSILYAEKEFIDIDLCNRIFRYAPTKMFLHSRTKKVYEIIQDLCKSEDVELLGTVQFAYKVGLIAGIEEPNLDEYVTYLKEQASNLSTYNYWIKKIQKAYFNARYTNANSKDEFMEILEEEAELNLETDMQNVSSNYDDALRVYEDKKDSSVFLPYQSIGVHIGSLQGGDMIVLAGSSGGGKTAMMLNLATGMAKNGIKVDIFSLEMPRYQVQQRMICSLIDLNAFKFRSFTLNENEKEKYRKYASEEFSKLPIRIYKNQSINLNYLKTVVMKSNADVIFIDYLGLIDNDTRKGTYENISEISREIKLLAMRSNKPIVCLHQLNREFQNRDDKKPKTSDIRDSGKIEQDADMIWFVYRPGLFEEDGDNSDLRFIIAKSRFGVPNKEVKFVFNGMYQQIREPINVGV